ncbi:MAG: TatD family hydrolase [Candidatus Syntrophoarchaeum sp.]|nr:TatD family hydrolase [Candidatus Syntrophoarchaeum sp.]
MDLVDAHCHIDFKRFDKDRDQVIQRAKDAGLILIINSGVDYETNLSSLKLASDHDFIKVTLGLNPNMIVETDVDLTLDLIEKRSSDAIGIGEVGLDYYRGKVAPAEQKEVFLRTIELARELDMPIILHSRDAEEDCFELVKDLDRVIFHCYGGNASLMEKIVEKGFYVSLATVICYSKDHRKVVERVPLENLLIETDSPFLSPFRGKRNEPAYVLEAAQKIAGIKGIEIEEVARMSLQNVKNVYGI